MPSNETLLLRELKDYILDINLRLDRLEQTIITLMKEKTGEDIKVFRPFGKMYE